MGIKEKENGTIMSSVSLTKALKKLSIKTLSMKMLEKLVMMLELPPSSSSSTSSSSSSPPTRGGLMAAVSTCCRKGSFAVYVGEEAKRYVIPLSYLKHPLFLRLLKKAEEEFGFAGNGSSTAAAAGGLQIPCEPEVFDWLMQYIRRNEEYGTSLNEGMMEELIRLCSQLQ